ncbi:hypothetical protein MPF_0281 [Methanohalophilus portucalensis FDF-1]|uniref:Uncharacterized protein n=1 Tax=Methanohalophilus portucalensis FDF-1 TaxID=523843 RepID=A0A1L9C4T2_9EURY|nr:hypothetical protein MPF_0281 [Methanohalophilus portucalensis FDF-1]
MSTTNLKKPILCILLNYIKMANTFVTYSKIQAIKR